MHARDERERAINWKSCVLIIYALNGRPIIMRYLVAGFVLEPSAWSLSSLMARATEILLRGPMTDKAIELDEHRGMAAQKATDLRRFLADVEANEAALRLRQEELETHLIAAPAANWEDAAEKARYLLNLFAATLSARDPRRQTPSRPCLLIFSASRLRPSERPGSRVAQFARAPTRKDFSGRSAPAE
jgi:hypothetical protein